MKKYVINVDKTIISFSVKHMVISTVKGQFKSFNGVLKSNKKNFVDSDFEFSCDVNSLDTNLTERDNFLKSSEFFDCEVFPEIKFKSTSIKKEADVYVIYGDLTVKNITRQIKLVGSYLDGGNNKNKVHNFELTGNLKREDYGLCLKIMNGKGNAIVSDEIKINIYVQFIEQ